MIHNKKNAGSKIFYCLLFYLLQHFPCLSQNTFASYHVEHTSFTSTRVHNTDSIDEESWNIVKLFAEGPVTVEYDMEIYSNSRYALIKVSLNRISLPVEMDRKKSEEVLIDYENKIYYEFEKGTYCKYKNIEYVVPTVKIINDTTRMIRVNDTTEKGNYAIITLNTRLPKDLTGKIILESLPYGIEKIETTNQMVTLKSFRDDVAFDINSRVLEAKKKCTKLGKMKNQLFMK